jgi:hypothetical protein
MAGFGGFPCPGIEIGGDMMDPELIPEAKALAPETREAGQKVGVVNSTESNGTPAPKRNGRHRVADDELPAPGTRRWVIRRKAQVVAAVQSGRMSLEDVVKIYAISVEEFLVWQAMIERHGIYGLRSTRSQIYRADPPKPQAKK